MRRAFILFLLSLIAATCLAPASPAAAQATESRYLSGPDKDHTVPWEFMVSDGRRKGEWTTIPVPSNWEMHGFGTYTYGQEKNKAVEEGRYRHRFDVPAAWKDRRVFLVFEGSMTDTEIAVNGRPAGPVHRGAFYEFRREITPLVRAGQSNLLEVTVREHSSNASVNRAERDGDFWVLGGIYRPVRLEAVPQAYIERVAIDARADGAFTAVVHVDGALPAARLTGRIVSLDGTPVGAPFTAEVAPGQTTVTITTRADAPRTWSAETPHLYRATFILTVGDRVQHSTFERFGFRTFEVRRGDGLYINGHRVLLKGVNRHSFWPESGRTTSREVSIGDVSLMKDMNMNAVRMSHYPPDRHFLEACDELGLYVIDELTGWQAAYDNEVGPGLVQELVRRDVNHPSVVFWANGNEGGFNTDLDDDYAVEDPQRRTVLHPWDAFNGIDTLHYAPWDCCAGKFFHGADLIMPTEFMHGLYDGGHGAGLRDYWNAIATHPLGAGGFLWVFADEGLVRTDRNGAIDAFGNYGADGIVGPHREKEASFFTIRSLWSPVVIDERRLPTGFDGRLPVANGYTFTSLKDLMFDWELLTFPGPRDGKAGHAVPHKGRATAPSVAPGGHGTLDLGLPPDWRDADALSLTATDPTGRLVNVWRWMLRGQADISRRIVDATSGSGAAAAPPSANETATELVVSSGSTAYHFDRATGRLAAVRVNDAAVPFANGPRAVPGDGPLKTFIHHADGQDYIVEATYDGTLRKTRWRVRPGGWLTLDYELRVPGGSHPSFGITFDAPADQITDMRWLGRGPYRVWKNRLDGQGFDVWANTANDTVTGQSWLYPEFRGFFADLYWATIGTRTLPVTVVAETPGLYLRMLTPTAPKDPRMTALTFPEGDLSFMHAIPPIGTKFHAASAYGPESQLNLVNGRTGTYTGTLHFAFGPVDQKALAGGWFFPDNIAADRSSGALDPDVYVTRRPASLRFTGDTLTIDDGLEEEHYLFRAGAAGSSVVEIRRSQADPWEARAWTWLASDRAETDLLQGETDLTRRKKRVLVRLPHDFDWYLGEAKLRRSRSEAKRLAGSYRSASDVLELRPDATALLGGQPLTVRLERCLESCDSAKRTTCLELGSGETARRFAFVRGDERRLVEVSPAADLCPDGRAFEPKAKAREFVREARKPPPSH